MTRRKEPDTMLSNFFSSSPLPPPLVHSFWSDGCRSISTYLLDRAEPSREIDKTTRTRETDTNGKDGQSKDEECVIPRHGEGNKWSLSRIKIRRQITIKRVSLRRYIKFLINNPSFLDFQLDEIDYRFVVWCSPPHSHPLPHEIDKRCTSSISIGPELTEWVGVEPLRFLDRGIKTNEWNCCSINLSSFIPLWSWTRVESSNASRLN